MEELKICYVWVKNFRNFKNAGINFLSSNKFEYYRDENSIIQTSVSKLPKDFFGKKIIEVTGLIGKNGSGKSNALELVCKILKGGNSTISEDFLIITKSNNKFICYHNFLKSPVQGNFKIETKTYNGYINPLKIIYFSNVYDQRLNNFNKEVADISNNNRYSKRNFFSTKGKKEKSDFEKQLDLINSDLFSELKIETPEKILITINLWVKKYNSSQKNRIYGSFITEFDELFKEFRRRLRRTKPRTRFYYLLVFSVFQETLSSLSYLRFDKSKSNEYYLEEFLTKIRFHDKVRTDEMISDLFNWMNYIWSNLDDLKHISQRNDIDRFKAYLKMLRTLRDSIDFISIEDVSEGIRNTKTELFSFEFNKNQKNILLKNIGLFKNSYFFDINWQGISSGHKAYLNIFSLINAEIKRIKIPNLLICIDEGDLYLHPKWQTEFFGKLINVLPKIYDGNIQLILTSHSPFLLSDIPKQCLTILDKNHKNYSINGIELAKETFAGNIYDLYESPFFLGNQRKSVFSTKKIKGIIKSLDENTINKNEIHKLIELIGDDVIRFHLEKRMKND